MWEKINSLMGSQQKQKKNLGAMKINNKLNNNQKEIANAFNQYFTSIGSNLNASLPASAVDPRSYLQGEFQTPLEINPVSSVEVKSIIKSLQSKTSHIDTFSIHIIKENADLIAEPVKILYNQSIETATFPNILKQATVTPIHKKTLKLICLTTGQYLC